MFNHGVQTAAEPKVGHWSLEQFPVVAITCLHQHSVSKYLQIYHLIVLHIINLAFISLDWYQGVCRQGCILSWSFLGTIISLPFPTLRSCQESLAHGSFSMIQDRKAASLWQLLLCHTSNPEHSRGRFSAFKGPCDYMGSTRAIQIMSPVQGP